MSGIEIEGDIDSGGMVLSNLNAIWRPPGLTVGRIVTPKGSRWTFLPGKGNCYSEDSNLA